MRTFFQSALAFFLVVGLTACAQGLGGGTGGDRDSISQQQLLDTGAADVHDAVRRLRPEWLLSRGPRSMVQDDSPALASVFMSGAHLGDVEVLRDIRPENVDRLQYYDAGSASARFGMGHPRGVIQVIPVGSPGTRPR